VFLLVSWHSHKLEIKSTMRITCTTFLAALSTVGLVFRGIDGRLHDPDGSRSLAFDDVDLASVVAFTPQFMPEFISEEDSLTKTCPSLPPGTKCTFVYEPVTCDGCAYPNFCYSTAASGEDDFEGCLASPLSIDENGVGTYGDFGLSNRRDCPLPDDSATCSLDFMPVKCDGCMFINACAAKSAKFDVEKECEPACPSPPPMANCTLEYEPARCNECQYSNMCLAGEAWISVGAQQIGCVGSPQSLDENGDIIYGEIGLSNDPDCPLPSVDADCPFDFEPLKCDGCIYINDCAAKAARFDVVKDCVAANGKPRAIADAPPSRPECPSLPPGTSCTFNYEPATCNGCPYPNFCFAMAAFGDQQQVACLASPLYVDENGEGVYGEIGLSNDPKCRLPDDSASCPLDFVPLKCDGCIYINACAAESAGFNVVTECTSAE
jgi:hypothetical protein